MPAFDQDTYLGKTSSYLQLAAANSGCASPMSRTADWRYGWIVAMVVWPVRRRLIHNFHGGTIVKGRSSVSRS